MDLNPIKDKNNYELGPVQETYPKLTSELTYFKSSSSSMMPFPREDRLKETQSDFEDHPEWTRPIGEGRHGYQQQPDYLRGESVNMTESSSATGPRTSFLHNHENIKQQPSLSTALRDHDFGFSAGPPVREGSFESMDVSGMTDDENIKSGPQQQEMGDDSEPEVYCICRTSDVDRFMIGCDKCSEWFHGDCINLHKHEAKRVKEWYCKSCMEQFPELKIKFKSSNIDSGESPFTSKRSKRVSRMCGECIACQRMDDCADCDFCNDMKKYGGEGRLRQKCRLRQCLKLSKILNKKSGKYTFPDEYIQQYHEFMRQQQSSEFEGGSYDDCEEKMVSSEKNAFFEEEDQMERKRAIKVKHAKQPSVDREKKKKEKELREMMKKQLREMKLEDLQRKKDEREQRRRKATEGNQKRKPSGHKDELGTSKRLGTSKDSKKDEPRHCLGPGCINAAVSNSKYCSDECGVQLALRRLQEILPERSKIWKETECIANKRGEKLIQEIHQQQQIAQKKLLELDKQHAELEAILEKSKELTICKEEDNDDNETDIDLTVYCVSCGLPLAPRIALRHMEKCYTKLECLTSFGAVYKSAGSLFCENYNPQQGTYCKRLRVLCPEHTKDRKIGANEVCGCPLNERDTNEVPEFCRAPKRKCTKHFYWEKLRRAEIDLKRLHEWWKLEEGLEQERSTRMSINNRGGIAGMLLHHTVDNQTNTSS